MIEENYAVSVKAGVQEKGILIGAGAIFVDLDAGSTLTTEEIDDADFAFLSPTVKQVLNAIHSTLAHGGTTSRFPSLLVQQVVLLNSDQRQDHFVIHLAQLLREERFFPVIETGGSYALLSRSIDSTARFWSIVPRIMPVQYGPTKYDSLAISLLSALWKLEEQQMVEIRFELNGANAVLEDTATFLGEVCLASEKASYVPHLFIVLEPTLAMSFYTNYSDMMHYLTSVAQPRIRQSVMYSLIGDVRVLPPYHWDR